MTEDLGDLSDTLEDIAYLTRSENRVQILTALAATGATPGEPTPGYTRRELEEQTEASQPTLSRILTEFEDRRWIERTAEGEYVATPLGAHLTDELTPFLRSIDALRDFGEVAAILPTAELTIDRHHFGDATIRRPEGPKPVDFRRYLVGLLQRGSSTLYVLSQGPAPATPGSDVHERIVSGRLKYVLINSAHIHDYFRDIPEARKAAREQLEAGAQYYSYNGQIPCNLFILDETVVIENSETDELEAGTAIESQNETVRTWALELFERYREDAEKLSVGELSQKG